MLADFEVGPAYGLLGILLKQISFCHDGLLLRRRLIPQCPADALGTLDTRSDRLAVAPGRSGAGPVRVRNVSLSKRLTPRGNKEKAIMDTEPKKQEPEIVPPAPVVEPARNVPEIPPDKDTPEKRSPVQGKAGLIAS